MWRRETHIEERVMERKGDLSFGVFVGMKRGRRIEPFGVFVRMKRGRGV